MTSIYTGAVADLAIIRRTQAGLILDGQELGELFLPNREFDAAMTASHVRVFIYLDSTGKPAPTTQMPHLLPGEIGRLRVAELSNAGAFLDWGLPKDLLLPFAEQSNTPEPGRWQTVKVMLDHNNRAYATTRIDRYLEDTCDTLQQGAPVSIVVVQPTDLGFKVAVENRYWGLLPRELGHAPRSGQRLTAYVQRLRDDQRLSLSLNPPGAAKTAGLTERIIESLERNNGELPLGDKSTPIAIRNAFACSKSAFKQAIGKLYKERRILIESHSIRLV